MSCTYCALGDLYDGFDARNQKKIDTNHAVVLLKYIFDLKYKGKTNQLIISFHGGEPLFNGDFIKQIVAVVNQLNLEKQIEITYTITTNATLLHKYIDFLVENEFQLLISLDGNEINHSYRSFKESGKETFHQVIENVDMIQHCFPEYFASNVRFNAVLHDRNSVKDIYEYIYHRYHKIPRIAELANNDVNHDKELIYNRMYQSKRKSEFEYSKEESNLLPREESMQYEELTSFLKHYSINYCISSITELFPGDKKYVPSSTCVPFWKKMMLTTNSKLTLCEKVNYHKFTLGEVDENVKIDIPKITNQYNYYYEHIKEKCQQCYINKFCGVCLFVMRNCNLDKLDKEDFHCEGFHDKNRFANKLYRIFSYLEQYPEDNLSIIENVVIL